MWSWLIQWMKKRSSSSIRGISIPNFEVLDARIVSALNKITHNSHFKRRISLEEQKAQKQDCFLRGREVANLIYDYFRVTETHDSVENYIDLFTIVLRNDDIQDFDSKWDGILFAMTKISPDDILEGLYKLSVNTIHLEPEIHEHIYVTKGYGTLCTTTSTFSPTLRPM